MKKTIFSVISILLCFSLVIPMGVCAFAEAPVEVSYAEDFESYVNTAVDSGAITVAADKADSAFQSLASTDAKTLFMNFLARFVNTLSNVLINVLGKAIGLVIPKTSVLHRYSKFNLDEYGNFFKGMDTFLDAPAAGAQWHLGYSEASIMPDDFGTVPYTMGGYGLMAETTETFDGLKVRTIVINDGSGRGNVAFSVLDAIGIANADVRLIREALADFAKANNIVSLNVSVTHTHSGIDLQGVWDHTVTNLLSNLFLSNLGLAPIKSGVNRTFLNKIIDQTSKTVKEAYADMTGSTLTLAKKDIEDYLRDRTAPNAFDTNIYRLEFKPTDKAKKPTVVATFGAHPENSGYEFEVICADFVPYIEEVLNAAGYNFIYIQGCIGSITYARSLTDDGLDLNRYEEAVRYGHEIGYILLGMDKTEAECAKLNNELGDFLGVKELAGAEGYSVWYQNWEPVEAETVKPFLNIAHKQYVIEVTNPLMSLIGKVGITDYYFMRRTLTGQYYSVTECGYMELGDSLLVEICPGETFGEMLVGGKGIDGFKYESLRDTYGDNMIVFDLMNDAIGYLEPDNEFVMAGIQWDADNEEFDTDSWCLISFGKHSASTVIGEFRDLVDSVR